MDYKKETIEILQKVNDDSLLEFFYVQRMSSGSVRKLRQVCIIPTKI